MVPYSAVSIAAGADEARNVTQLALKTWQLDFGRYNPGPGGTMSSGWGWMAGWVGAIISRKPTGSVHLGFSHFGSASKPC